MSDDPPPAAAGAAPPVPAVETEGPVGGPASRWWETGNQHRLTRFLVLRLLGLGRLTAGLLNKAERGELALALPAGLTRDAGGGVIKDPDREVRDRIALVFTSFLEQGSVGKVMRSFARRDLGVPQCDRFGEAVWRPATLDRITRILRNPAYAGAFVYGRTRSRPTPYCNGKRGSVRRPPPRPRPARSRSADAATCGSCATADQDRPGCGPAH